MTKNHDRKWAFRPGRARDAAAFLWAVHDGKNRGRSEGEENIGEFPVTVGGRAERCAFLSYRHARGCEALGSN